MDEIKKTILEGSSEITEAFLDQLISNEIIKSIPVLGTAIKIGFTVKSISDRMFLKKVERFLTSINEVNQADIEEQLRLLEKDQETQKKVGECLVLLLERFSDWDKPNYLAQCYLAYLSGKISLDNFIRIGGAIDFSHSPDLKRFILNPKDNDVQQALMKTGLTGIARNGSVIPRHGSSAFTLNLEITELGNVFLNIFNAQQTNF